MKQGSEEGSGVAPDCVTYSSLANAYAKRGLVAEAAAVVADMQARQVNVCVCVCIYIYIYISLDTGRPAEAVAVLQVCVCVCVYLYLYLYIVGYGASC